MLILALLIALLGGDPSSLLQETATPTANGPGQVNPAEQPLKEFVSVVLADTEDVWGQLFQQQLGRAYRTPTLVLYSGQGANLRRGGHGCDGPVLPAVGGEGLP